MLAKFLRRALAHPLTDGIDLDDPATTALRTQILSQKPFLQRIYDDWYRDLAAQLPNVEGPVVELGSGAGYGRRYIPGLITSDLFPCATVQLVADAQQLPFGNASLRAIVFTDVMHHIPDVRKFLSEASRCLRSGGKILMVEPWVGGWSRFVYRHLHHEPFKSEAKEWSFEGTGPLSSANTALPWIVFVRDRRKFECDFPLLKIERIRPFLPFCYLLSGGMSMRSLMPAFTYPLWKRFERLLESRMDRAGMFMFVSVVRS